MKWRANVIATPIPFLLGVGWKTGKLHPVPGSSLKMQEWRMTYEVCEMFVMSRSHIRCANKDTISVLQRGAATRSLCVNGPLEFYNSLHKTDHFAIQRCSSQTMFLLGVKETQILNRFPRLRALNNFCNVYTGLLSSCCEVALSHAHSSFL